ncbi:MAG: prepilin-type N-terminal cleavage/methylation domain-containing protein [Hyphomicrobiaceae bacterium]
MTRHDTGISLLEMLVAMAILSLALVIAVPLLRSPDNDTAALRTKATLITAQLRFLRSTTQRTGQSARMTLDLAKRTFDFQQRIPTLELPDGVALKVITDAGMLQSAHKFQILFFPDGSATGVTAQLRTKGLSCTIRVISLTGSVLFDGCKS